MTRSKNPQKRYSLEVRERAVRMVLEHGGEYKSQWTAIQSIAGKIGCTGETLRGWVRQAERDTGRREGLTSAERDRMKALEREVKELRCQSAFFHADLHLPPISSFCAVETPKIHAPIGPISPKISSFLSRKYRLKAARFRTDGW